MENRGTAKVSYDRITTSIGTLFAATRAGAVCRIALGPGRVPDHLDELSRRYGQIPVHDPGSLARLCRELKAYLAGESGPFSLTADLSGMTPFQVGVLRGTEKIPYGQVASYGEIARRIGRPGAARAVGNALNANPVPLIVPCHRVVAGNGLGGFGGGVGLKERLLKIEGWL